jgi:hypothetical protein
MKHLLFALLLATLCATGYGQTIKSLGYNTNGVVIGPTNTLTFTNSITKQGEAEFGGGLGVLFFFDLDGSKDIFVFDGGENDEARARENLGLGATWLTNTNVTNFRDAIGLGNIRTVDGGESGFITTIYDDEEALNAALDVGGQAGITAYYPIVWTSTNNAATTRINLSIPLPALTNTSNVTMMRALAGSTNTNQPFSGAFTFSDGFDVFTVTVSNGIILSVAEP